MGQFTLDLTRNINRVKGDINLAVQKVTYEIFKAVILKTPVDEGRARANWIASANSYERAAVLDKDKTGTKTAANMGALVLKTPAGGLVYLVNNVAYIKYLEYGRDNGTPGSSQAPQGMVRITLLEYQNYFNKAIKEARK